MEGSIGGVVVDYNQRTHTASVKLYDEEEIVDVEVDRRYRVGEDITIDEEKIISGFSTRDDQEDYLDKPSFDW